MEHKGTQEIKTERLLLRRFTIDDYMAMFVWASNPEVTKYLSYFPHKNPDETKELLEIWVSKYDCDTTYNWAIEYNGLLIGNIDVVEQSETECHLGWQIDSPYWNKGIMTEAAKAVLDYLFNIGFEKISSAHDTRNIGSGRVMQKIGMIKYDTIENYLLDRVDRIITKECYAITKTDWMKSKEEKMIIHCMTEKQWNKRKNKKCWGKSDVSKNGFIHCSAIECFWRVAPNFRDINESMVLVCIDESKLKSEVIYENPDECGNTYPHIYGVVNNDAVIQVVPFLRDENGNYVKNPEFSEIEEK